MLRLLLGMLGLAATAPAVGADVCPQVRHQQAAPAAATRIAAVACNEHLLWHRPFIDANGRIASATVSEAEASRLADGSTAAWQRVATYWRDSGLLPRMIGFAGAPECGYAGPGLPAANNCRGFILDQPWSAAFISWVMRRAALPGFRGSATHFDYVRDAYLSPADSAFQFLDPVTSKPASGDMLCYVRVPGRALGHDGLRQVLAGGDRGLPMHCEVVAAVNPGNDGIAYLVGGNVQQAVTMRMLPVNRAGLFWSLPLRSGTDPDCSPETPAACSFSRQDWAVLLKLKPADALAQLAPPLPTLSAPVLKTQPACCLNCIVGAVPPVPRCPKPLLP